MTRSPPDERLAATDDLPGRPYIVGSTKRSQTITAFARILIPCFALAGGLFAQDIPLDTVRLPETDNAFTLAVLPGGSFQLDGRVEVTVSPFAIMTHEVLHDDYRLFQRRENDNAVAATDSFDVDGWTRPSPPYLDFTYGMGTIGGFPQVNVTQQAALRYAEWLYHKTGRFFRLPTEAEWAYACEAGGPARTPNETTAWLYENGEEVFHRSGEKAPNAWGLYDLVGNVAEWTMDQYAADYHERVTDQTDPVLPAERKYGRTVRGGSYDTFTEEAGCALREKSSARWQVRDPQIPRSRWWNVDAPFVGFRLVSPREQPTAAAVAAYFKKHIVD